MRWRLKTMKNKLPRHKNRTRKMYGGVNFFGKHTDGKNRVFQLPKDKTFPFMYFYIFEEKVKQEEEEEDAGEEY